jgi:hypothetical protein
MARKVPVSLGTGRQSVIGRNAKAAGRTVLSGSRITPPACARHPPNPSSATRAHPGAILLEGVGVLAGKNGHALLGAGLGLPHKIWPPRTYARGRLRRPRHHRPTGPTTERTLVMTTDTSLARGLPASAVPASS